MKKRFISLLICTLPFALHAHAKAQQPAKVHRIGYLTGTPHAADANRREAFRNGLREDGYIEGKNIIIEWRSHEANRDRQRTFVAELVRLKVDVIVAVGVADIRAAKEATSTIPIVMVSGGDPVRSGLVASLARPGGNVTGLATLRPELSGKQMELLKEIVPGLARVSVFADATGVDYAQIKKELDLAGAAFGVKLQHLDTRSVKDVERAFQAAVKGRADAVIMQVSGPVLGPHRNEIAALAVKSRLPAIYRRAVEVEAGGLMSYGVSVTDLERRAAFYVDKILKGAKPADLPVEQPTKFEFIINLKAARQIGLTIPPGVLARADRVIR